MTFTRRLSAAAITVLLLGGVALSGQNRFSGPDQAGIAETKTMHAAIIRAIEANTRAQVAIARLASQDARIAVASAQAADAQRDMADATRARVNAEADIRRLTQSLSGQSPEQRVTTNKEISERRAELSELIQQEQGMRVERPRVQQVLAVEQARRNELSAQLDDLERLLPALK